MSCGCGVANDEAVQLFAVINSTPYPLYFIYYYISYDNTTTQSTMKSIFTTTSAVVFATSCISLSSHSTAEAFTTPQHSQIQYVRSSSSSSSTTLLPSTLVSDTDMVDTTTQQSSEQLLTEGYEVQNTNEVATQKKYLEDGFIFGLESSGLERPKGKNANVVVEGDSLETTPKQVAIVSATFAGHALIAANAIHTLLENTGGNVELTAATSLATIVSSWVLADLGSGIFHWSVDNYGNGSTPVMGNIIAAFQGHHSAQWTITYRGFCNNVWKLCIPFGVPTAGVIALLAGDQHPMGKFVCMGVVLCVILSFIVSVSY